MTNTFTCDKVFEEMEGLKMNPQMLYQKNEKNGFVEANILFCSKCGTIYKKEEIDLAEKCCRCRKCGEYDKNRYCKKCFKENQIKEENVRFEKAEKIKEYNGKYFYNPVDDEYCEEHDIDDLWDEGIKYLYATKEFPIRDINAWEFVYNHLEDHHENAIDEVIGVGKLQKAFDIFCEENKDVKSFCQDESKVIIIEEEF